jgi:NADH-quinone oxidoreductase subunit M
MESPFDAVLLNIALWLPLVGAVFLLLFADERGGNHARVWAAWISGITLVLSAILYFRFQVGHDGMQFVTRVDWLRATGFNFGSSYSIGLDGISMPLFLLNALLGFLGVLASWYSIERRVKLYYALLLILNTAVAGVFASMDFFLFFLFFELEIAPMFLLIGIWGSAQREYAAFKFILYTLFGSSFLLLGIIGLYFYAGADTFDMAALSQQAHGFPLAAQTLLFILLFIGFAVKLPVWPLHTWLPDAHSEAPTAGSVILAGVLLKMGGYGMVRLCVNIFPAAAQESFYIGLLAAINVLYGSYLAIRQVVPFSKQQDFKRLIACSSIASMGFVLLGLASLNQIGLQGAVLQMVTHGLYSGLLFLTVGLLYDRTHTREIPLMSGLMKKLPFLGTLYMVAAFAALGLPGTATFISEITVLFGGYSSVSNPAMPIFTILVAFGVVLAAGYMLWSVNRVFHGPLGAEWEHHDLPDARYAERFAAGALAAVIFVVGIFPGVLATMVSYGIAPIAALFTS